MTCPNCAAANPETSLFCLQCGEPLTASAAARKRNAELREKKTKEIELTEAVAARLAKWSKWLAAAVAVPALISGVLLGKGYWDFQQAIKDGQAEIKTTVNNGTSQVQHSVDTAKGDLAKAQTQLLTIDIDIQRVKTDVAKYDAVNKRIDKLQSDLLRLQSDVVDLGSKSLKAKSLETTGPGGGTFSLGETGCSLDKARGSPISLCAQGSPLLFNSMTLDGRIRPIASVSNTGFQDISRSPRPACTEEQRGTIFILKGSMHHADKPYVCVKDDSDGYTWVQFTTVSQ